MTLNGPKRRALAAHALASPKHRTRIVRARKGRGSYNRKGRS
jgi:stalled ribosome alternative rescue factor ArfA